MQIPRVNMLNRSGPCSWFLSHQAPNPKGSMVIIVGARDMNRSRGRDHYTPCARIGSNIGLVGAGVDLYRDSTVETLYQAILACAHRSLAMREGKIRSQNLHPMPPLPSCDFQGDCKCSYAGECWLGLLFRETAVPVSTRTSP